eukprot:COSAG05_NODE_102_length_19076_cov_21.766612_10_plen_151_part_00
MQILQEKIKISRADGKNQDRVINARVYAAQILAENATLAAKEALSDNGGDPAEPGVEEEAFDINACADEEFAMNVMLELAEESTIWNVALVASQAIRVQLGHFALLIFMHCARLSHSPHADSASLVDAARGSAQRPKSCTAVAQHRCRAR